jgi:peptide chain release factor subunit 1
MSSVETIIVWENLSVNRLLVKNTSTGEERVLHLTPEQEQNDSHFRDAATGTLPYSLPCPVCLSAAGCFPSLL